MIRIGAALFNADHGRLADEVARLEQAGVDFVHLDVFDGYFVPDVGFAPRTIATLRALTRLPFEVHLGARDPLRFVPALVDAGVDRILIQIESCAMPYEVLYAVREHGVGAGLALSLGTPVVQIEPLLGDVESLLFLSRVTGEGVRGAMYSSRVVPRVQAARGLLDAAGSTVELQVAGGINRRNAAEVLGCGARALALGAGLYRVPDMGAEVQALRALEAR